MIKLRINSASLTVVLVLLAISIFTITKLQSSPLNCGHKGGYDCMKGLPENSLALLEQIEILQRDPNFKYLEFDIRETKDNELVVFHDKTLLRMLPNKGYNLDEYKNILSEEDRDEPNPLKAKKISSWTVSDLTVKQLQRLSLEGREPGSGSLYRVPTLESYIEHLKGKLYKPIVFEIKQLDTPIGRDKFTTILSSYKNSIGGNHPSGTRYNSFPYQQVSVINLTGIPGTKTEKKALCQELKNNGIEIYRGWTHDSLCDFFYDTEKSFMTKFKELPSRIVRRVAVKYHILEVESELDSYNYHEPRLLHLEPENEISPQRYVYTPIKLNGQNEYIQQALTRLLSINKNKLLVYIHGRGRHPKKGQNILNYLADKHDTAVLMFNWDSWICRNFCQESIKSISTKHPYGNAVAAAPALGIFMQELRKFKSNNADLNISVLVHSMGNIVLKETMMSSVFDQTNSNVFIDNLILNSADVELEDHSIWLNKIEFAEDVFVTMSRKDVALGAVELMLYKPLLGLGIENLDSNDSLAKNAHYIDFSRVSSSHRKFGGCTISNLGTTCNRFLRGFFTSALGDDSWTLCPKQKNIFIDIFDDQCVM